MVPVGLIPNPNPTTATTLPACTDLSLEEPGQTVAVAKRSLVFSFGKTLGIAIHYDVLQCGSEGESWKGDTMGLLPPPSIFHALLLF